MTDAAGVSDFVGDRLRVAEPLFVGELLVVLVQVLLGELELVSVFVGEYVSEMESVLDGEMEAVRVKEDDGVPDLLSDGEPDVDLVRDAMDDPVLELDGDLLIETVPVGEELELRVVVGVAEPELLMVGVAVWVEVGDGDSEIGRVADGELVSLWELDFDIICVRVMDTVPVAVRLGVMDPVWVGASDTDSETDELPVLEADEVREMVGEGEGDGVADEELLAVRE